MPLSEVVWEFRLFARVIFLYVLFCLSCQQYWNCLKDVQWVAWHEDQSSICHINLLHPCNICSPRTTTMATSKSFSSFAWNITGREIRNFHYGQLPWVGVGWGLGRGLCPLPRCWKFSNFCIPYLSIFRKTKRQFESILHNDIVFISTRNHTSSNDLLQENY